MGNGKKKVKLLLFLVILILLGAVVAVFMDDRRMSDKSGKAVSLTHQDEAHISIGKVRQTSTRNGMTEWTLEADSARYLNERKQVVFEDLSLTFFLENAKKLHLTASQGVLSTASNDIEMKGTVVLKDEDYTLSTESLCYENDTRMFSSNVPVEITGARFDLKADSMSFDLNTNRTSFEGNVKGTLIENVTL